jgi:hypothetical protein
MHLVYPVQGTFTTTQLARLEAYRAAVAAGFYSDWDGSAETTDVEVVERLRQVAEMDGSAEPHQAAAYPFSAEEQQRLERCRAAIAAGYYSEEEPPAAPVEGRATPE